MCTFVNTFLFFFCFKNKGGVEGAERLSKSRVLMKLLKEHTEAGKVYGGTHSSVVILEKKGLLKVYTLQDDPNNSITNLLV
jgi:hypothetical protein